MMYLEGRGVAGRPRQGRRLFREGGRERRGRGDLQSRPPLPRGQSPPAGSDARGAALRAGGRGRQPRRPVRSGAALRGGPRRRRRTRRRRPTGSRRRRGSATSRRRSNTPSASSTASASPPNEAAAAQWFQRAAEVGNPIAQNRLARLLATGRGITADPLAAAKWHLLAKRAGKDDDFLDQFFAEPHRRAAPDRGRRGAALAGRLTCRDLNRA